MLNTTEKSVVFLFAFIKILLYTKYGGFMKKVIYLNSNNVNLFYRKFRLYKFLSHFNINFIINYCGKEYTLNDKYPQELGIILNMTDILNTRNKKEKYNKIYDRACDYLDNEFRTKNICDFKNNMCRCNREKCKDKQVSSCCESLKSRKICENFDNEKKECKIKSLGCKLFVCPYLIKKGYYYRTGNVPYLKYFLSPRQKLIALTSHFKDKDENVNKMIKFYKLP